MNLIDKTINYLNEILGILISPIKYNKEKLLPQFLRQRYEFYNVQILDSPCLFMIDKEIEKSTPAIIKKHIETIHQRQTNETIYISNYMDSFNRKRLIEHRVSFVVPGNQMFLPFIGIDLREHMKISRIKKETFSPSAQLLILSLLLGKLKNGISPGDTAVLFGYSAMTMTRAFDELENKQIGKHSFEGKNRLLRIEENPEQIWEKALPLLSSPIKRSVIIAPIEAAFSYKKSGDSALSHYTMIAEPGNSVFAVSEKDFKKLKTDNDLELLPYPDKNSFTIEIWKYSPELLSDIDFIDPLSLYLSKKDVGDERIEASLEELIEKMTW